ncbi:MAG: hypothetical protein ACLGIT_15625 [Gammaproteobacteria bacterium]
MQLGLDRLAALAVRSAPVGAGDPLPRHRLLGTTRLHAPERLAEAGETDATLRRHAGRCIELAEVFDAEAAAHGQAAQAPERLDAGRDTLLHALAWCGPWPDDDTAATGPRLAAALRCCWGARPARRRAGSTASPPWGVSSTRRTPRRRCARRHRVGRG